jgi:Icc protein
MIRGGVRWVIVMPVHFAQITDTHVVAADTDEVLYVDNNARLAEAVASINDEATPISAVLATGDMTQWGAAVEFAQLAELLAPLTMPVLPVPGNHDDRAEMRRCFPDHPWADTAHLSWVVAIDGVRIIGLDSTVPGEAGAAFDDDRERWLEAMLGAPHDGPTILAMHHPPFITGIGWMDRSGFDALDRFEAVVRESGAVDRIVCGHVHRPMSAMVGGVLAEVGPSTAIHVALDLEAGAPKRVVRDAAGYRIFRVHGSTIVGHVRSIGTGEAAFVPAWALAEAAAAGEAPTEQ